MSDEEDWSVALADHPVFSLKSDPITPTPPPAANVLSADASKNEGTPTGKHQIVALRDMDLIVAVGKEIRISSLGDGRHRRETKKSYKSLHTPNIQFEIRVLSLNPSGKLLAVAGTSQVAVVVLPRPGFNRIVPPTIDCKSVQVGQFYHASDISAPIAKIEWHPWGEAGSTLLVMTTDGKLREYDISVDPEEPQQVLSFISDRKSQSFLAEDTSEREIASFTIGKGNADWGPLTVYAVTKSGDIYSISPYMPQNASVPSSYVHALECFISAKQEYLSQGTSASAKSFATMYDYQRKYVTALVKQLPPDAMFPVTSTTFVPMHPPSTLKNQPIRQGPFLLQPSPRTLEGSEGGDATDIIYLSFRGDDDDRAKDEEDMENIGIILVAFQDGKVDVCLDVEKVEARWEDSDRDLPMLAVYETIDLGLISTLDRIPVSKSKLPPLDLLQGNHPIFLADPIHEDVVYLYHAFGVHSLYLGPMLQSLGIALRAGDENEGVSLRAELERSVGTSVRPILDSFSVERGCSDPIIGVAIPNDVFLTYSIFMLTSTMCMISHKLTLMSEVSTPDPPTKEPEQSKFLIPLESHPQYISLLADEPYIPPPILSQPFGLPSNPRLSTGFKDELMLTPETMRYLGTIVESFTSQIHAVQLAYRGSEVRADLQRQEFKRLQDKCREILELVGALKGRRPGLTQYRLNKITEMQKSLLKRLNRVLQVLMEQASPELSEHEAKWFQELKRMKGEVMGSRRYDEDSLVARTSLLQREFARIMPSLTDLVEKEKERRKKLGDTNQGLGLSQAFHLGEISNYECSKIVKMEEQVLELASKLDLTLGRPAPRP